MMSKLTEAFEAAGWAIALNEDETSAVMAIACHAQDKIELRRYEDTYTGWYYYTVYVYQTYDPEYELAGSGYSFANALANVYAECDLLSVRRALRPVLLQLRESKRKRKKRAASIFRDLKRLYREHWECAAFRAWDTKWTGVWHQSATIYRDDADRALLAFEAAGSPPPAVQGDVEELMLRFEMMG